MGIERKDSCMEVEIKIGWQEGENEIRMPVGMKEGLYGGRQHLERTLPSRDLNTPFRPFKLKDRALVAVDFQVGVQGIPCLRGIRSTPGTYLVSNPRTRGINSSRDHVTIFFQIARWKVPEVTRLASFITLAKVKTER